MRAPQEVHEYESRVWDLTRHLVHPAFLYVVFQVAFWCALERHPGIQFSFGQRTLIHAIQFLGAWGVFYGTLLRDMGFRTRVVTVVLWLAALGTAVAWMSPVPADLDAGAERDRGAWLEGLLLAELLAGFTGWVVTMAAWLRAKAGHVADRADGHG